MTDALPAGWNLVALKDLSDPVREKNLGGNTNVLTISAQHGLVNQRDYFKKSVASKDLSNYTLLKRGDFAYNKSYSAGYPVGVTRSLKDYDSGVLSPLYLCFDVTSELCDNRYIEYFFDSYFYEAQLASIVQEGARAHGLVNISRGDFFDVGVALPPLSEQVRIAEILGSVDDVIEHTRTQIAKLQDLKTATMNELLTKGIGHTEFKDTELGPVPESWLVRKLTEVCLVTSSKRVKQSDYVKVGVPFYRSKEIILKSQGKDLQEVLCIPDVLFEKFRSKHGAPLPGDLLVTAVGTIGVSYLVEDETFYFKDGNLLWLKEMLGIDSGFLSVFLNSDQALRRIQDLASGSSQSALTIEKFSEFLVLVPSEEEQRLIALVSSSLDQRIVAARQNLDRVELLKKSLMQDLLTGKVRVSV